MKQYTQGIHKYMLPGPIASCRRWYSDAHPYWSNGLQNNYRWNLLSDLSYFSYEVDASTARALTTNGWNTAPVIDSALANGVRVNLCVTLFSGHATFFANANAQTTLINNLLSLVQTRGADGVNIDFEDCLQRRLRLSTALW